MTGKVIQASGEVEVGDGDGNVSARSGLIAETVVDVDESITVSVVVSEGAGSLPGVGVIVVLALLVTYIDGRVVGVEVG
jgi:hypothetical protein